MRIDDDFMAEVGLGAMPEAEKQAFMQHAEEELEVRVGHAVGAYLSDDQLLEFDQITDVDVAAAWLNKNVPNYLNVVEQVFQTFKQELITEQQKILGM